MCSLSVVLVALGGHEEQNSLPVASMDYGFFTDEDDGEHTKGATPSLVVKVMPSMMIWSTPVPCKSVDDQAAIKDTVESLNRLGHTELIVRSDTEPAMPAFRDAVISELKERFGVRAIAQAPPKYDSASAGVVENAIKQVKEKVRTLVIATRELHGVVMDPEHVALAWCVRFAGQIISRSVKGADGLTAFQRAFQRASHSRDMPAAWEEKILYLEASKKKIHITDKFLDGIFLSIKEGSEEFIVGTTAGCVVCRAVKGRPREDAADPVFFNRIRGTPNRLLPDDEPREAREPREQPLRIDVRPVHTALLLPISTEPAKPCRVHTGSSVELARDGYAP